MRISALIHGNWFLKTEDDLAFRHGSCPYL